MTVELNAGEIVWKIDKHPIKTYRDLIVWQKAHSLAKQVIENCRGFPKDDEARVIKRQLIRSSTSIPANIAEGHGGHRGRAYRNYLIIARRSASETDYWILLVRDLEYIGPEEYNQLQQSCTEVMMMLSKMISKLGEKTR